MNYFSVESENFHISWKLIVDEGQKGAYEGVFHKMFHSAKCAVCTVGCPRIQDFFVVFLESGLGPFYKSFSLTMI